MVAIQQAIAPVPEDSPSRRPLRHYLPLILGVLPAIGYGFFALIAYLHFPTSYSPIHNTLSELGSPLLNPAGSGFYRVGCVIGGSTTIAFFLTLTRWRGSGTELQNRFLTVVQAFGMVAGLAMVMFAVFADNEALPHRIILGILATSSLVAMLLSLFALWRPHRDQRWRTAITLMASSAIVLMFAISDQHWAEWIPAILSQVYIWSMGYETVRA